MYTRILEEARLRATDRSVLVLGPRQVGKSTLLSSLKPDLSLNLASPRVFRDYASHPEQLERELAAAPPTVKTVFLRRSAAGARPARRGAGLARRIIPGRFRFLMSGSSARKLRRARANLLPGRVHVHHMHPLLASELGEDFDLDRVLAHGDAARDLRAGRIARPARPTSGATRTHTSGKKSRRKRWSGVSVALAASSTWWPPLRGGFSMYRRFCRDAGLGYETTRRYIDVLEDTLVVFRVPAWSGSSRASLVRHPRLFLFDIGVRNALLRRPLDAPLPDERGILLEHMVACELHRESGKRSGPRLRSFTTAPEAAPKWTSCSEVRA